MKKNIGLIDRVARLSLATIIVVLFIMDVISGTLGILLLVVAGSLAVTSLLRFCPAYMPFKINTSKRAK